MKRLSIILTHPIQYYAPVFSLLERRNKLKIKVFYTKVQAQASYDQKFQKEIVWDIPLLEGYDYHFQSTAKREGRRKLIATVQSFQPDAILIFGWNPPGHLPLMQYFKGKIPVFFRGDSTLLDEKPGLKRSFRRIFLTWVYRYIDYALYVGIENKKYFKAHGVKDKQMIYAPHAIDNERFEVQENQEYEKQAAKWRERLAIKPEQFVVVFVGKFEPKKNPVLLLSAVLEYNRNTNNKIHLVFAGSGEREKVLRDIAKKSLYIHFIGFQNQTKMPIVYRVGNLFCLPSAGPEETWGLAVNEAMACGRPVLMSSQVGCAKDLASASPYNLVFRSGDISDLIEKLKLVIRENLEVPDHTIKAAIGTYSFEAIAESIEKSLVA